MPTRQQLIDVLKDYQGGATTDILADDLGVPVRNISPTLTANPGLFQIIGKVKCKENNCFRNIWSIKE